MEKNWTVGQRDGIMLIGGVMLFEFFENIVYPIVQWCERGCPKSHKMTEGALSFDLIV